MEDTTQSRQAPPWYRFFVALHLSILLFAGAHCTPSIVDDDYDMMMMMMMSYYGQHVVPLFSADSLSSSYCLLSLPWQYHMMITMEKKEPKKKKMMMMMMNSVLSNTVASNTTNRLLIYINNKSSFTVQHMHIICVLFAVVLVSREIVVRSMDSPTLSLCFHCI